MVLENIVYCSISNDLLNIFSILIQNLLFLVCEYFSEISWIVFFVLLFCISRSETTDAILYSILIPNLLFVVSVVILVYWLDYDINCIALLQKEDDKRELFQIKHISKFPITKSFKVKKFSCRNISICFWIIFERLLESARRGFSAVHSWLLYSALHRLFKMLF